MAELSGFRRYSNPAPRRGSLGTNMPNVQRGTLLTNLQRGSISHHLQRGSLASVATTTQTTGHSWLYIIQAMRKQYLSLLPGLALCACAIIINSYFYYFDIFDKLPDIYDGKKRYSSIDVLTIAMFYLGACIGCVTCGVYQYTWPARLTNYVIGGVLIVSSGFMFWENTVAFCVARFLAGFSYGFIYISLIVQIADNVMKTVRGYMATHIAQATQLGLMLGIAFSEQSFKAINYMRIQFGIVLILLPIVAIIMNHFLTFESITRLLKMGMEDEARNILNESRRGKIDAAVIQYEIDERKHMLCEDYDDYDESKFTSFLKLFTNGNAITLIWMILLRVLNVLTANMYLFILSAISIYRDLNYLMHIVLMFTRLLIVMIPQYSIDKLGRRSLLLTSGIGSSILLFPFVAHNMDYIQLRGDLLAIITFGIHIFAALGIEPVQHIYVTEAFPLSKRNGSLAIVTCIEYILQEIIAIWLILGEEILLKCLLIASPFAVLLLTIILFAKLPETKSMPLRRCRDEFNKNIIKKSLPPLRVSGIHTLGSTYM